jgi:hypothetical protein
MSEKLAMYDVEATVRIVTLDVILGGLAWIHASGTRPTEIVANFRLARPSMLRKSRPNGQRYPESGSLAGSASQGPRNCPPLLRQ